MKQEIDIYVKWYILSNYGAFIEFWFALHILIPYPLMCQLLWYNSGICLSRSKNLEPQLGVGSEIIWWRTSVLIFCCITGGSGGGSGEMIVQQDTIFVSGMDPSVTEDDIASHFGQIGVIKVGGIL